MATPFSCVPCFMEEFNFWLEDDYFDQSTKDELLAIRDNQAGLRDSNTYALIPFAARHSPATSANSGDILREQGCNLLSFFSALQYLLLEHPGTNKAA